MMIELTNRQEYAAADYLQMRLAVGGIPCGAGWVLDIVRGMIADINKIEDE